MKVTDLKKIIKSLPNDMEVFVGCEGYSNFDFENNKCYEGGKTIITIYDGKLFITDECAIETNDGSTLR